MASYYYPATSVHVSYACDQSSLSLSRWRCKALCRFGRVQAEYECEQDHHCVDRWARHTGVRQSVTIPADIKALFRPPIDMNHQGRHSSTFGRTLEQLACEEDISQRNCSLLCSRRVLRGNARTRASLLRSLSVRRAHRQTTPYGRATSACPDIPLKESSTLDTHLIPLLPHSS